MRNRKRAGGRSRDQKVLFHAIAEPLEHRRLLSAAMDPAFGTAGIAPVTLTGNQQIAALQSLPSGNVLAVINMPTLTATDSFVVECFTPAGLLNPSFGTNGVASIAIGGGANAQGLSMQPIDDKILVVGTSLSSDGTSTAMTVVRLNTDGSLDTTFGSDGIDRLATPSIPDSQGLVIYGTETSIGVVGTDQNPLSATPGVPHLVVAMLDLTGAINFNNGVPLDLTSLGDFLPRAAMNNQYGQLILGGPTSSQSPRESMLVDVAGTALNTSFGTNGIITFGVGDSPATSLTGDQYGSIYTATSGPHGDIVYQYHPDGSPTLNNTTVFPVTDASASSLVNNPQVTSNWGEQVVVSDQTYFNGIVRAGTALVSFDGVFTPGSFFPEPGTEGAAAPVAAEGTENWNVVQIVGNQLISVIPNPASVEGLVYNDTNENGSIDTGEQPLAGITYWVDVNHTGVLAANDPQATSGAGGKFTFNGLLPNNSSLAPTYFYVLNDPAFGPRAFTVRLNVGLTSNVTLGLSDGVSITGHVTEAPSNALLAGVTVFADQNANNQLDAGEPSAVTDSLGNYRLTDLPAGTYAVTVALPASEAQVFPISGSSQNITVGAAGTGNKIGPSFVLQPTNGIVGTDYIDNTGLGQTSNLSVAISVQAQVYIDTNNNGVLDAGDIVSRFDSNGHVIFRNLSNGTYTLRLALNSSQYVQTIPANNAGVQVTVDGSSLPTVSFAEYVLRSYYGSFNTASFISSGPPPAGTAVTASFTAPDGTPSTRTLSTDKFGNFSLSGVAPQTSVVFTPATLPGYTVAPASVTENSSGTTLPLNFLATAAGSISGTVFQDNNGNGVQDTEDVGIAAGISLSEFNAPGGSVVWSGGVGSNANGSFSFVHLPPGYYQLAQQVPSGFVKQTAPAGGTYSFSLAPGAAAAGYSFGDLPLVPATPLVGKAIGTGGANSNSGIAAAFDGNFSTYFDGATPNGDWVGLDLGSGYNITQISFVPRAGYESRMSGGTFQASNVPDFSSGVATLYTFGDGASPASGQLTNLPSSTGLNAAYRYVRYLGANGSYGDIAELQFYGLPSPHVGGVVGGAITNGYIPTTIYLDANNNDELDGGELVTTTDASGHYLFSSVPAGGYVIRQQLNNGSGYTQLTPANNAGIPVTVADGSTFSAGNFNDRPEYYALTGKLIGTSGSYKNNGNTSANAFDGNLSTYFDGPTANGNWIGLDLGSPMIVVQINIASRPGYASRMNGGVFQASNSATFSSGVVNLYTIGKTANPPSGTYTEESSSTWTPYRYVRYMAPANSYGDVAEIQFIGKAPVVLTRFTGTVIGTAGSYQNKGNTAAKAFDGNLSSFFDGPAANGNWVGLDLGQLEVIQQIAFAPRSGYGSRMVGGIIQASTTADFSSGVINIYTITNVPVSNQLTTITLQGSSAVQARYFRYLSPANSYGDIAEVAFYG